MLRARTRKPIEYVEWRGAHTLTVCPRPLQQRYVFQKFLTRELLIVLLCLAWTPPPTVSYYYYYYFTLSSLALFLLNKEVFRIVIIASARRTKKKKTKHTFSRFFFTYSDERIFAQRLLLYTYMHIIPTYILVGAAALFCYRIGSRLHVVYGVRCEYMRRAQ